MANLNLQKNKSNEEIDFNFFDDNSNDKSETNNNAVVVSNKTESNRDSIDSIDSKKKSKEKDSSQYSDNVEISSSEELDGISSSSHSLHRSSSARSSLSVSKSHSSQLSNKSFSKLSPSKELSASPQSSLHRSPSESDVTTVSSLESESAQKNENRGQTRQGQHKNLTVIDNPEDFDRVQPEAILRAMIRIHEERRAMRQLRPKWVDPNTKDYSVSGLTAKLNLVPERIVSAPRKNIRDNPFYMHFNKASRRPYHTALNREKELDRIEKENRAIYDRIKKVQPSPGITKQELLREYSKINRFSLPASRSPYESSLTTSYRTGTAPNSRSSSQARRSHSSASVHNPKSDPSQTLVSRKYGSNGRVMSANSVTSNGSRGRSSVSDQRRVVKKSRY